MTATITATAVAYYTGPYVTGGMLAEDTKRVRAFVRSARKNAALAKAYVDAAYTEAAERGVDPTVVMSDPASKANALPRCKPGSKTTKFRAYEASGRILKSRGDYTTHCSTVDDLAAVVGL